MKQRNKYIYILLQEEYDVQIDFWGYSPKILRILVDAPGSKVGNSAPPFVRMPK